MKEIRRVRRILKWSMIILILLTVIAIALSIFAGRYYIGWDDLKKSIWGCLLKNDVIIHSQTSRVLWRIRLPRIVGGILVGSSLSVSGATFQAVFKNPMASSNILGVNQGAALGAAFGLMYFLSTKYVIIFAFIMGLSSVGLTYLISSRFRGEKTLGLVLSGMMIGTVFQAGVSYLKLIADQENVLPTITYWLMGSLNDMSWLHIKTIIIPVFIGFYIIFSIRGDLNLLTLGGDKAQSVGANIIKIRILAIVGATLLTASSVAISGMIGWISLLIPHMCRFIVGPDNRYLIPCSALMGVLFLVIIDTFARTLAQIEIPIGILTAFIGAPLFLLIILKGKGGESIVVR